MNICVYIKLYIVYILTIKIHAKFLYCTKLYFYKKNEEMKNRFAK